MYPCLTHKKPSCPTPAEQVKAFTEQFKDNNPPDYVEMFLDVEVPGWLSNKTANQMFIAEFLDAFCNYTRSTLKGWDLGIYTNLNSWSEIVGKDWVPNHETVLWYAHYDGKMDFNDFIPFGPWYHPRYKQYTNTKMGPCGVQIDEDCHGDCKKSITSALAECEEKMCAWRCKLKRSFGRCVNSQCKCF